MVLLQILQNSQEKTCGRVSFLITKVAGFMPATKKRDPFFIKKETLA